ncbi:MAG: DUF2520 domain-containing protein, partial [Deltaproteobacteria bacterium]|nr:DUF2520 domain-containing protein [Deltaproteobacteria bacterium]
MRIGVFGGSFNPPHHAHVMAAGLALSGGAVDRLLVLPSCAHPFAKPLAPFEDRMEMCRRAFALFGQRVEVGDLEARLPAPGYTVDTLRALRRERPGDSLRLVLGTDLLDEVDRWKDFPEVCRLAPPLWIGREGRRAVEAGADLVPFPLPDISSSGIRARLAGGCPVEGLVPAAVAEYLRDRALYTNAPGRPAVLVLGLGRAGSVLARWLLAGGCHVRGWDPAADPGRDAFLAGEGVSVLAPGGLAAAAAEGWDLMLAAAPDSALGSLPPLLEAAGLSAGIPALHLSGAAPARILGRGRRPVGRMHPVFPFPRRELPLEALEGLTFVLEGDADATARAAELVVSAGGLALNVESLDPIRYHAACVLASNFMGPLVRAAASL